MLWPRGSIWQNIIGEALWEGSWIGVPLQGLKTQPVVDCHIRDHVQIYLGRHFLGVVWGGTSATRMYLVIPWSWSDHWRAGEISISMAISVFRCTEGLYVWYEEQGELTEEELYVNVRRSRRARSAKGAMGTSENGPDYLFRRWECQC